MIKRIFQRLITDPILAVHIIGKRYFWNYFWLLAASNLIASLIISATGGGQLHLGWRETFLTTTIVGLGMPLMFIAICTVALGKENFFFELEDFVHVVKPNFSLKEDKKSSL